MRRRFRLAAAALSVAMLTGDPSNLSFASAPAEARWYGDYGIGYGFPYGRGYGYGYGYRRHHDVDTGDVIAAVAVIAGVAAIATAASQARDRDRWDRGWDDRGWDDGDWDDGDRDARGRDDGGWNDRRRSRDRREDVAVDECRAEAERQARTYGTSASLRDIQEVDRRGDAVRIRGLVEIARSEAVPGGTERRLTSDRFTCVVRGDSVESYRLGGNDFASRR